MTTTTRALTADDLKATFDAFNRHDIDGVTGATLTTRATADAVRRMLAYYEVLLTE